MQKFIRTINQSKYREYLILFFVFVISMLIRLIGIKHGFPLLTHPDEDAIIFPVFNMAKNHTLNPGNFNRPNQILYMLNFIYLNLMSILRFGENFATAFPKHQLNFYFYARLLISFMGSLIPIVAYKIGKEFRQNFALPALLVFAFFPSYILHSLYITPDIPITLFTLIVIFFTIRYLNRNDEKSIYFAIIFSAINTAEKYPGLISLMIVFLGVLLKYVDSPIHSKKTKAILFFKDSMKYSLIFIAALFIVAPNIFLNYRMVYESIIFESQSTHLGADNLGWAGNLYYYIETFGSWSNIFSIFLIGVGIFALAKWRDKYAILFFYGALYWVILSKLPLHWERWALPMYITPLFLISISIAYLWSNARTTGFLKFFTVSLFFLYFAHQLIASLHTSIRMSFTDTRVVSLYYCQKNDITRNNSLFDGYSPLQPQHPKFIIRENISEKENIDYLILSSGIYARLYKEPNRYKNEIESYDLIREQNTLIKKFSPTPMAKNILEMISEISYYIKYHLQLAPESRYNGPTIEIYQKNK